MVSGCDFVNPHEFSQDVQTFWAYACSLRRAGALPRFRDFELMDIHSVSPQVIVLDVCDGGERLYNRFVGTAVVELFGETTGKYMDEIDIGGYKAELLNIYARAIRTGDPQWSLALVVRTERLGGVYDYPAQFTYERLVFPLTGEDGEVAHLAAILVSQPVERADSGIIHKALTWPDET